MADSENKPSLPPLSPSPHPTSPGGGDGIISTPEPDTLGYIRGRFNEHKSTNNDNNEAIPRVPRRLRRFKNDAYGPNIISIGPYHRGNSRLQAMEKRKFQCISGIMNSLGDLHLIEKLELLEKQVRECYTRSFKPMSTKEFVEMMLLDSYFIIRVLELTEHNPSADDEANLRDLTWIALYDLLLLENQLPFFLIQYVFGIIYPENPSRLISLAHRFFRQVIVEHVSIPDVDVPRPLPLPTHLLQLYHQLIIMISPQIKLSNEKPKSKWINFNCQPFFPRNVPRRSLKKQRRGPSGVWIPGCVNFLLENPEEADVEAGIMIPNATVLHGPLGSNGSQAPRGPSGVWIPGCVDFLLKKSEEVDVEAGIMIPNATVLHEAGIKFKKSKGGGILDVKFNGGVLEIPPLFIDDGTFSLFSNFVALEDCYAYDYGFQHEPQFTAYFKFLDHIINTVSDVVLLQNNGIIEHTFGSEKEVADLFNQLTRGATINPNNYLSGLYEKVNEYRRQKRHIWGAIFLRRHCSNPLTILSTLGFLFLLALTCIQSFFAVYAYFRPPS